MTTCSATTGTDYRAVTRLPAWEGFFVFAKKTGLTALFPYEEAVDAAPDLMRAAIPPAEGWSVSLAIEREGRTDADNRAGVRIGAASGVDRFDRPEPPRAPEAPSLAFWIAGKDYLARADYRSPITDGATWELSIDAAGDASLRGDDLERIPAGMSAWIALESAAPVRLVPGLTLTVPAGVQSGRLIVGTAGYFCVRTWSPVAATAGPPECAEPIRRHHPDRLRTRPGRRCSRRSLRCRWKARHRPVPRPAARRALIFSSGAETTTPVDPRPTASTSTASLRPAAVRFAA